MDTLYKVLIVLILPFVVVPGVIFNLALWCNPPPIHSAADAKPLWENIVSGDCTWTLKKAEPLIEILGLS